MSKKKQAVSKETVVARLYEVLAPLRHDGDEYESGDTVELNDDQAQPLLSVNVIVLSKKAKSVAAPPEGDSKTTPPEGGDDGQQTNGGE